MAALLLAAAFAWSGCDRDTPAGRRAGAEGDTAAWALGSEPEVRLDASGGRELDRVFSGFIRPDGLFVVGSSGTSEVLFFAADGRLLRASGREGQGPGEFQAVSWVGQLPGDSILVYDVRAGRYSVLDSAGGFARSFSPRTPMARARPLGVFPDGTVLAVEEGRFDPRGSSGRVRDRMGLYRLDLDGEVARELGEFAGAEWLSYGDGMGFRTTQLPFGRTGYVALAGDRVVYGSSDLDTLAVHDHTGARVSTLRLPLARRRLEGAERQVFLESLVEGLPPAQRAGTRQAIEGLDLPTDAPLFTDLRADRAGNLWVQATDARGGARWTVLAPDGRVVGSLATPGSIHLLDVRGDAVLVRETDEDGAERVALYRVRK